MDCVACQENANQQANDRWNVGNACRRNGAEILDDEVVDNVRETRPTQSKTKDQTGPRTSILQHSPDSLQPSHQENEDHRESDLVCGQRYCRQLQGTNEYSGVNKGTSDAQRTGNHIRNSENAYPAN